MRVLRVLALLAALAACLAATASGMQWAGGAAELSDSPLANASPDLVLMEQHAEPAQASATVVAPSVSFDPSTLPAACPAAARAALSVCVRLVATLAGEGGARPALGMGESVCGISRFALDEPLLCAKVYEHLAEVRQRWDLDERLKANGGLQLCLSALAEPVHSRAMLSPRTERKCAGTHTPADTAADLEPEAPVGYTGNILEDPFGSGIVYTDGNCRCECRGPPPCKGCSCSKRAAVVAPAQPQPTVAPAAAKAGAVFRPKTPLAPFVPPSPAACVKGAFLYEYPYSAYLPAATDVHVVVDAELQRLRVYSGALVLSEFEVSTSEAGLGSEVGSLHTPTGSFRVSQKIGAGAPLGADIVGLRVTTRSSGPDEQSAVQTRALVLDGLDDANRNTRSRLIYLHGTNKVAAIGRPASQGSIRLRNADVVQLFDSVPEGARVFVVPRCAWPKEQPPKQEATAQPAAPSKVAVSMVKAAAPVAVAAAPKAACKGLGCLLKGMLGETTPRPVQRAAVQPSAARLPRHKKRTRRAAALQANGQLA